MVRNTVSIIHYDIIEPYIQQTLASNVRISI